MPEDFSLPDFSLQDVNTLHWKNASEMIRFREETRPHQLLEKPIVIKKMGRRQIALIAEPKAADDILFRRTDAFPKASIQKKLGHHAFGPGLSGTVGEQNLRQRRAFHALMTGDTSLKMMRQVAQDATKDAIDRYLRSGTIDLSYEMAELALQIIWATLLGPGIYEGRDPMVTQTVKALYHHPKGDFVTAAKIVKKLSYHFESSQRWRTLHPDNPLSEVTNPEGWQRQNAMSQEELRANVTVMAASGHVTTGLTLAWVIWLLALFPEHQAQVYQEIQENSCEEDHAFLRQVINETLRLYPPGAETMRDAKESLTVDRHVIHPGALVIVSFYALHRHQKLWSVPNQFRPERFSATSKEPVARAAFLPFSGGPGGCSGPALAWVEMISVLKTFFQHIKVNINPKEARQVGVTAGTCIYPDRALRVHLTPR
ncbi:cytochrome P450 [Magnetococcales bacterium HHB-1]